MTLPDRRQVLRYILLAGMSGTAAVTLSGCIGSGLAPGLSKRAGSGGLDPSKARIITTAAHTAKGASLTSAYRAGKGLGPVTENAKLQRMAEGHALAMARTGKVEHSIGFGDNFVRRLYASGYDAQEAAENIAGGFRHDRRGHDRLADFGRSSQEPAQAGSSRNRHRRQPEPDHSSGNLLGNGSGCSGPGMMPILTLCGAR